MWKDVSHQLSQKEIPKMNTKCMKKVFSLTNQKTQVKLPMRLAKNTKNDKPGIGKGIELMNPCIQY